VDRIKIGCRPKGEGAAPHYLDLVQVSSLHIQVVVEGLSLANFVSQTDKNLRKKLQKKMRFAKDCKKLMKKLHVTKFLA